MVNVRMVMEDIVHLLLACGEFVGDRGKIIGND